MVYSHKYSLILYKHGLYRVYCPCLDVGFEPLSFVTSNMKYADAKNRFPPNNSRFSARGIIVERGRFTPSSVICVVSFNFQSAQEFLRSITNITHIFQKSKNTLKINENWQTRKESNLHYLSQNQMYYRYTTGLIMCATVTPRD